MILQSEVATVLRAIPRRPNCTQDCRADEDDEDDDTQSRFVLSTTIFIHLAK